MRAIRSKNKSATPWSYPLTKLKHISCVFCKHQFFVKDILHIQGSHIPLLLECGHPVCSRCVMAQLTSKGCPWCSETISEAKENRIEKHKDLLVNVYMLGMTLVSNSRPLEYVEPNLSFQRSLDSKLRQSSIGQCLECGIQATVECPQCEVLYCIPCYSKIHRKALRFHKKILLSDESGKNTMTLPSMCSKTCEETIGYYCKECNISCCSHCFLRLHPNHSYTLQLERNKELMPEFTILYDTLGENLSQACQAEKKWAQMLQYLPLKYQEDIEKVEAAVNQHFVHLHGVLQLMEDQIIEKLNNQRKEFDNTLEQINKKLLAQEAQLRFSLLKAASAKENLERVNLQEIIHRLEELAETPYCCFPQINPTDTKLTFEVDKSIVNALKTHCTIRIPPTPEFTLVPMVGHSSEHSETEHPELKHQEFARHIINVPTLDPLDSSKPASLSNSSHAGQTESGGGDGGAGSDSDSRRESDTNSGGGGDNNGKGVVLDEGTNVYVAITHIEDPSNFYVQSLPSSEEFLKLSKQLEKYANDTPPLKNEVLRSRIYVVQSELDKMWYRARIINVEENESFLCDVVFVDIGRFEKGVSLSNMRNIDPGLTLLPSFATNCCLFNIAAKDDQWSPEAIEVFRRMTQCDVVSMHIINITGNTYYVDLCTITKPSQKVTSVRESLIFMGYASFAALDDSSMVQSPCSLQRYYVENLPLSTYVKVFVRFVESPSSVYVVKAKNFKRFQKILREMHDYCVNDYITGEGAICVPQEGLPCVAQARNQMINRAVIREIIDGKKAKIFFVDLGYAMEVKLDKIKKLPTQYMTYSAQAIKVCLKDIKPLSETNGSKWKSETNTFMKQFFRRNRQAKVFVYEKIDSTAYNVRMFVDNDLDYNEILVSNELADYTDKTRKNILSAMEEQGQRRRRRHKQKRIETTETEQEQEREQERRLRRSSLSRVPSDKLDDPFKVPVHVLRMDSPDSIYVGQMAQTSDITEMKEQMQNFYNRYRGEVEKIEWEVGKDCAVYSAKDKAYLRARILNIEELSGNVEVFLYDLAAEEIIEKKHVQPLAKKFTRIPSYALKIKLAGILPCGGSARWPILSCKKLQEIIETSHNNMFYISKFNLDEMDDGVPVELWVKQTKMDGPLAPMRTEVKCVNRMLVDEGVALPVRNYSKDKKTMLAVDLKKQLKLREVTIDSEEKVRWISNQFDLPLQNAEKNKSVASSLSSATRSLSSSLSSLISSLSSSSLWPADQIDDVNDYSALTTDAPTDITNAKSCHDPKLRTTQNWLPAIPLYQDEFIGIPTYVNIEGAIFLHSTNQNVRALSMIEERLNRNSETKSEKRTRSDRIWKVGDACIAKYHYNDKWYRARVLEPIDDYTVKVEFVDYGNVEECSISMLRRKLVLDYIPIQCTKCVVHGLVPDYANGKWSTRDLDRIHALLVEKECKISVLDRTKNPIVISITLLKPKKCDLLDYLFNDLKMKIKPWAESLSESPSGGDTPVFSETPTKSADISINEDIPTEKTSEKSLPDLQDDTDCHSDRHSDHTKVNDHPDLNSVIHTNESISENGINDFENTSWMDIINAEQTIFSKPEIELYEDLEKPFIPLKIPDDVREIGLELSFPTSPTSFYAILRNTENCPVLKAHYSCYESIMADMQQNASKQPLIKSLAPGTPCSAKFNDGIWYRCLIVGNYAIDNTDEFEVVLRYVDFGNMETRIIRPDKNELYTLKEEWFVAPAIALQCQLWSIESTFNEAPMCAIAGKLGTLCGKPVTARIMDRQSKILVVELYSDTDCTQLFYSTFIDDGLFHLMKTKKD